MQAAQPVPSLDGIRRLRVVLSGATQPATRRIIDLDLSTATIILPVESPEILNQKVKWTALSQYIEANFHKPDLEALRCVLAAERAHFHAGDPVWLFVIGPSGSGKTAIVVQCASAVDRTYVESSVTTKSLLSGTADGQKSSLLEIIGSGIIIFKDFTTILSKRDEDQKEIVSQFREVFDGRWSIRTGQRSAIWEGKITVIAAVTPAIERAWAVHRDLGERFLQVRWFNNDSLKIASAARLQRGREKLIGAEMKRLTREFFSAKNSTPSMSDEGGERIDILATVIARLRGKVNRDTKTKAIIDATQPEEPTRIAKALDSLVCHHAGLFAREITEDDFRIALRVGFDSVPHKRSLVMEKVPLEGSIFSSKIANETNQPHATIDYHVDELGALGVLTVNANVLGKEVSINPQFLALWLAIQPKT